ncbi:MAG: aminotransferase class V-fold PLP-dependent enzyme, partial [Bacteroidota bacterium]
MTAISAMEVQHFRSETTGTQHVLHFNNAGAALMPDIVRDTVIDYLHLESKVGGYEAAQQHAQALNEGFYGSLARMIGAKASEIAFTDSATTAWYKAFRSLELKAGDVVLTGQSEYCSNYIGLMQARKQLGIEIEIIPNDESGAISPQAMEKMIRPAVKLIAISHIPTNGGLINPAAEIGRIARSNGIFYLLDACQSLGQMAIDVNELQCDMLAATGRKFLRGPRGTGF